MSKSYLNREVLDIRVNGIGETQHQAIDDSFKNMRKKLSETYEKPIISMRTVDYIVHSIQKTERQEAYLFFFMKRKRENYKIDVTIKIEIEFVNLEGGK